MPLGQRAWKSPQLKRAKLLVGRFIGEGQHLYGVDFKVKDLLVSEKQPSGKIKRFRSVLKNSEDNWLTRGDFALMQRIYRKFKQANLPVPSFSRTIPKDASSRQKIVIVAENLEKKHGKLYDGHKNGELRFPKQLSIKEDRKLLVDLAKDLATIHNLGIACNYVDYFHFYKKGNSYDRVIVDFDKLEFRSGSKLQKSIYVNLRSFLKALRYGPGLEPTPEFKFFLKSYLKYANPEIVPIDWKEFNSD
ncbi:MAG: hypothetical protein WC915_04290 [archaeon]|jgi:hypothetical protein